MAEAACAVDRIAEGGEGGEGFRRWAEITGVDPKDLHYVGWQRALRAAVFLIDKRGPKEIVMGTEVKLSAEAEKAVDALWACWVDGFAAGVAIGKKGVQ